MPALSLIIPAKDAAPYLPTMFASLHRQGPVLETTQIIFIDDGSADATPQLLAEHGARLPHFEVIRNETARGLANGRNQGIAAARGRYIAFLDGDDWLAPGHLSAMVEAIEGLGVDFVRTDHVQVEASGKRVLRRAPMAVRDAVLDPRLGILPVHDSTMVDYPFAWAGIFDARLAERGLLQFPADFMTAEDRSWIWGLHLGADSFAVVDSPGIRYRRGLPSSLSQVVDARQLQFCDAFAAIFALVTADAQAERFWAKAARNWLAILHHQTQRFAAGSPVALRREFARRARAVSAPLPPATVHEVFAAAPRKRQAAVLPFLPERRALLARAV
ncbi:glycosyltransferase family 2 protein [Brevibacterium sp. BRM-1]|uniref:glycosyltransferase family 2 protein n=1 Tax=Brevibacterium sp. BRM-1 TaxID=2999062 RepID=UPI00228277A4|nr:glycosyltransferase family 2 protein [Brevibacterium sp. BRM-1]WAL40122.1 glycosyltransferase family 2 protein [Brevibacterium sp. BRM-1]